MKRVLAALLMMCLVSSVQAVDNQILYYESPARSWMKEFLSLGNGSLGCKVSGGVEKEHIQFNEDTLWVGSERDTGSYQTFGDIYVELQNANAKEYRRALDISRVVHTTSYKFGDVSYKREYFSSQPAQVMVFRYTADKKASLTGKINLVDAHNAMGNGNWLRRLLKRQIVGSCLIWIKILPRRKICHQTFPKLPIA